MNPRKFLTRILLIVALAGLLFLPTAIAKAQDPTPPPETAGEAALPEGMVGDLLGLGGVAACITALVNAGKRVGIVKDGQAPAWAFGLNLVGMAGYLALQQLAPDTNLQQLDATAGEFAKIGFIILGLVGQMAVSRGTNAIIKGTPVIGYQNQAPQVYGSPISSRGPTS